MARRTRGKANPADSRSIFLRMGKNVPLVKCIYMPFSNETRDFEEQIFAYPQLIGSNVEVLTEKPFDTGAGLEFDHLALDHSESLEKLIVIELKNRLADRVDYGQCVLYLDWAEKNMDILIQGLRKKGVKLSKVAKEPTLAVIAPEISWQLVDLLKNPRICQWPVLAIELSRYRRRKNLIFVRRVILDTTGISSAAPVRFTPAYNSATTYGGKRQDRPKISVRDILRASGR